ncbi:MAG: transglycosylase family protein [Acidimicrobiales bacterium]
MRRIMFALLVIVLTAVVPLSSRAGAAVATKPPRPPSHKVVLGPHRVVDTPLRHALVRVASSVSLNIDELRDKWQQVAICEVSGNWSMVGPSFSGIGFANGTWSQYGGRRFAPLAGDASRDQQIIIGMRVVHGQIPDQDGCSPYGW